MKSRLSVILAGLALLGGWGALIFTVFGPSYATASSSWNGDGTVTQRVGSASMLDVGIEPRTIFFLALFAASYLAVFAGAVLVARGQPLGRWLMVAGLIPLLALGAISFGLVLALPATLVATVATVSAFRASRGPHSASM